MPLSLQIIQRLTPECVENLSKLFPIVDEVDFLSQYLSQEDIQECLSSGATNSDRMNTLVLKLIVSANGDIFDEFCEYFLKKSQQFKEMYLILKHGKVDVSIDRTTENDAMTLKGASFPQSLTNPGNDDKREIVPTSSSQLKFHPTFFNSAKQTAVQSFSQLDFQSTLQHIQTLKEEIWDDSGLLSCNIAGDLTMSEGFKAASHLCTHDEGIFKEDIPSSTFCDERKCTKTAIFGQTTASSSSSGTSKVILQKSLPTSEKRFACHICNKRFLKASHVKTHMLLHTGEKPFICHICLRAFNQKSNLRRHSLRHGHHYPDATSATDNILDLVD